MPPLQPVPNVVKLIVTCAGNDGRIAQNVTHYRYSGAAPGGVDCIAAATAYWNSWATYMTPQQPAQTSLTKVEVIDLSSPLGGSGEYTNSGTPVPGTSTHGMLPINTAALVSKFVPRRFRGGHPRSYLPIGTTDDLNDDGDWKPGSVTNFTAAAIGFFLSQNGNAFGGTTIDNECIVTYFSKNINPVAPYTVTPPLVTSIPSDRANYTVSGKLATQRRRVRRTGHS